MSRYIARRILQAVPLILGVVVLTFLLVHLAPGDPVYVLVGEHGATAEFIEEVRRDFGLDRPLSEQLMIYLGRALRGDLGFSYYYRQAVIALILERLPATLLLMGTQLLVALTAGVGLGVLSARRPNSLLDNMTTMGALVFYSMPVFWSGLMAILLFSSTLDLFPAQGMFSVRTPPVGVARVLDIAHHLALPALTLGLVNVALYARLTRTSMLEVLGQDYVRTARAKGLRERRVLLDHALRNALLPVLTVTGLNLGRMIGGAVLTETVFGWPGLGRLMFESLARRDFPVLVGMFLFISVAVLIANLLTDLGYGVLDPRIRYA